MKKQIIIDRGHYGLRAIACNRKITSFSFGEGVYYQFTSQNFEEQTIEMCDYIHHRFEDAEVHINLPPEKLLIREFDVPFTDRKKIKELVPHEIESLLPYEMDEVVYEYRSFADYKTGISKIVTVASPKDFVVSYTQALVEQNISIKSIYVPMEGLYHLTGMIEEPNAIYLMVSPRASRILVIQDGKWQTSRVFPLGYDVLVRRLASSWKRSEEESKNLLLTIPGEGGVEENSEYIRKNFRLSKAQVTNVAETIQQYGAELVREIHRTVDSFQSEDSEKEDLIIYLATDMGNQIFLENLLSHKLGSPVYTFPYDRTPVHVAGREYFLAAASGVAISSSNAMNLYTKDLRKSVSTGKSNMPIAPVVTLAVGLVFFIASFAIDFFVQKKAADALKLRQKQVFQQYFGAEPTEDTSYISQATDKLTKEQSKSEIYRKFLSKAKLLVLIQGLQESIETINDIEIRKIIYAKEELKLHAETDSYEQLSQIQAMVQKNPVFSKVERQKEYAVPGKDGTSTRVRFILVMKPVQKIN
ncbi:MAG: hypothetical protein ABUK01_07970 [Leptospirales bacterium]